MSPGWADGPGPVELKRNDGEVVTAYMEYDTIDDELVIELKEVSDGSGPWSFHDFVMWRVG